MKRYFLSRHTYVCISITLYQAAVDTSEDETCQTFVMHDEDHTLGNSLRYIIMKK